MIITPGIVNVDFADVRAVLTNSGSAIIGIGIGSGKNRAQEAARLAVHSPLLEVSADGARGVLFTVSGKDDLSMWEVQEAAKMVTENVDKEAKIIFGAVKDERLRRGEIKITVIAAGFQGGLGRTSSLFQQEPSYGTPAQVSGSSKEEQGEEAAPKEMEQSEWDSIPAFLRRSKKI